MAKFKLIVTETRNKVIHVDTDYHDEVLDNYHDGVYDFVLLGTEYGEPLTQVSVWSDD